jgi:Tol biopolymer transport system component
MIHPSSKGSAIIKIIILIVVVLFIVNAFSNSKKDTENPPIVGTETPEEPTIPKPTDPNACQVASLKKADAEGLKIPSPDGKKYIVSKEDNNKISQIYMGTTGSSKLTCITCTQEANGPKVDRFKMQPTWHSSGKWIFVAVERDEYTTPPILGASRDYVEGQLQSGIWTDMWAITPDGKQWKKMTSFKSNTAGVADGYTGPAITPDGKKAVWSQAMDGNILNYWPFGRWELTQADIVEENGMPRFTNLKNITPKGMHWNEPGNFSPDNQTLVISGSTEKDQQGMDQYTLNIKNGALKNLTNTPTIWDEHGYFSPDGKKIIFMSAYPYREDPNTSVVLFIKTDFMIIDSDGKNMHQLTYFRTPGHAEYTDAIAAVGSFAPDGKSASLSTLSFPNYQYWTLTFKGNCGNN